MLEVRTCEVKVRLFVAGAENNIITLPNVSRKKDALIVKVPIERGIESV